MKPLLRFLDSLKCLGRRKGKPAIIREDSARRREIVARVFKLWLDGYNAGLETPPERLLKQLSAGSISDSRGLFDGAFAGVASLYLSSGADEQAIERLLAAYPEQAGSVGLGIGAAISHLGINVAFGPELVSHPTGWLCVDSFALHNGYFHWDESIIKARVPPGVGFEARRPYNQGLGRSLWAVGEANPALINEFMRRFDKDRLPDLWHGLGLMIGYWGCYDAADIKRFLRHAGKNRVSLQLGVALATMLRMDTDDIADHTEGACNIICGAKSQVVADMVQNSLKSLSDPVDQGLFDNDRWHYIIKHTFVQG